MIYTKKVFLFSLTLLTGASVSGSMPVFATNTSHSPERTSVRQIVSSIGSLNPQQGDQISNEAMLSIMAIKGQVEEPVVEQNAIHVPGSVFESHWDQKQNANR